MEKKSDGSISVIDKVLLYRRKGLHDCTTFRFTLHTKRSDCITYNPGLDKIMHL